MNFQQLSASILTQSSFLVEPTSLNQTIDQINEQVSGNALSTESLKVDIDKHVSDKNNPHSVTIEQIGAQMDLQMIVGAMPQDDETVPYFIVPGIKGIATSGDRLWIRGDIAENGKYKKTVIEPAESGSRVALLEDVEPKQDALSEIQMSAVNSGITKKALTDITAQILSAAQHIQQLETGLASAAADAASAIQQAQKGIDAGNTISVDLSSHLNDTGNPHKVTASQVVGTDMTYADGQLAINANSIKIGSQLILKKPSFSADTYALAIHDDATNTDVYIPRNAGSTATTSLTVAVKNDLSVYLSADSYKTDMAALTNKHITPIENSIVELQDANDELQNWKQTVDSKFSSNETHLTAIDGEIDTINAKIVSIENMISAANVQLEDII